MGRTNEHAADLLEFKGKHVRQLKDTENGACLNAHNSSRDQKTGHLTESSCNYRWQGFKQALKDDHLYNGKHPKGGKDWDISEKGDNFRSLCKTPYWHESHHIVPHGELRDAISQCGAVLKPLIRGGLLDEKYNLNHMGNMIILPVDSGVAQAIDLPRHRKTKAHRSHKAYSRYVRGRLDKVFKSIRMQEKVHAEKPDYPGFRQDVESISKAVRPEIVAAGGKESLDEHFGGK
ncbi:MAG: AHH domain-containing protein [Planctomycetota bacterium]